MDKWHVLGLSLLAILATPATAQTSEHIRGHFVYS